MMNNSAKEFCDSKYEELFSDDEDDSNIPEKIVKIVSKVKQTGFKEMSISKLTKHIKEKATGYEVILGETKPYYDWEKEYDTENEQKNALYSDLLGSYNIVKKLYGSENIISFYSCGYSQSKKKYKNSFHYRIKNFGYCDSGADIPQLDGFDQSVYKREGKRQLFRLPYCSKEGDKRPLKRMIINFKPDGTMFYEILDTLEECKKEANEELIDYLVSVWKIGSYSKFRGDKLKYKPKSKDNKKEDRKSKDEKWENNSNYDDDFKYTKEQIENLLECVNTENQNWEWDDWTKMIWTIRNIADKNDLDLRDVAHKISKQSDKYDELETDKIYDAKEKNPSDKPRTIGSLIKQAKEDNPKMYLLWREEIRGKKAEEKYGDDAEEMKLINSCFTDGDVADYVIYLKGDDIRVEDEEIYMWKNHYWAKSDDSMLSHFLDTVVYKKLKSIVDEKFDNAEDYKKYIKTLEKINKLRNCRPRANFIKAIMMTISQTQTAGKFDNNPDLLCFTNGVYDLKNECFRDGKKEDLCSQIVPYDWKPSTEEEEEELMKLINKIMPHEDERDCLLTSLSSCLDGRLLEYVLIMTGKGRNGKDTLLTGLLKNALGGSYYYNGSTSVLTQNSKGGISQEKANMHNKRTVIYAEPSKSEPLKCANLKELTGCPEFNARGIYSKKTEIKNVATTIIHTNAIPDLDVVDNAISNRLVIFPFRSLFYTEEKMSECPPDTQNLYLVNRYYKSQEFIENNKLVLINILIKYYKIFKANGYVIKNIPETMKELAKNYMSDSDDFLNWFEEEYEKTDDKTDCVKISDMFVLFKGSELYQNLSKKEKRKNNKKNMIKEISDNPNLKAFYRERIKIKGKDYKNVILMYKKREPEDDDDDE